MIAKKLITNLITPISLSDTGSEALYHMDENKISFYPIVDQNKYLGLISETDVYNLSDPDQSLGKQKVNLINESVNEYQHVFDVIRIMSSMKISVLPVLDEKMHYIGCITTNGIIEQFSSISAFNSPGSVIILELNQNDFVLSQIAQIIESQDAKVLTLYLASIENSTKMEIVIKINKVDIQSIIQTLTRYNYTIKATFTMDEDTQVDLRDRYDSLMNYLNI